MEYEEDKLVDNEEVQDQEIKYQIQVVPVQSEEAYENVARASSNSFNNISHAKGKNRYYKQTYRSAWEQMPDFHGWLKGVEGKSTRAFCIYCHKTLHAHRLSLLKHATTLKHLKAEQNFCTKENHEVATSENEDLESPNMEDGDTEHENDEDEGDKAVKFEIVKMESVQLTNVTELPPILTKVTDLSKGRPISGLQVSLYKLIDGKWTYINEGITNASGVFSQFLERCDFIPGRYKLHYDVDRYFDAKKQNTMFPFIETVFDCTTFADSHHISLLLGPYGYTTYKC